MMDPLSITVIVDKDRLDKCLREVLDHDVDDISESLTRIMPRMPVKVQALKLAFDAQSIFMDELNARMSSNEDAIKTVRQRLIVSTSVKEELDSRIENDTKKIKDCMRALTQLRKETRNINVERDVLVEKKKELMESTTTMRADIHRLHVYAKTLNKQRSLADGRISYLNDTIAHLSTMEEDLNCKIKETERCVESLRLSLHDAEVAVDNTNDRETEAEERTDKRLKKAEEESAIAQENARVAQENAHVAQEKERVAQEKERVAHENIVTYDQRSAAAAEQLSSVQKQVLALKKKASAAEKRAAALQRRVEESEEYMSTVSDGMERIVSKRSLVSSLNAIIASQDEIIASREKQLKMNLHTIIHRDKDLIRAQNVITRLHQEISEVETDIALAMEYAHRKRLSILKHSLQEIS